MVTKSAQWEELCERHAQAMSAWRDVLARNCAGIAAVFRGNVLARPSFDAIAAQEKAWELVVDTDQQMKDFLIDNP